MASATALIASGCVSDECLGNKNALPLAGFYSSFEPQQALVLDSVTICGTGANNSVQTDAMGLSQTYLPFRIDCDSTAFIFRFLDPDAIARPDGSLSFTTDTLIFRYERQPYFVSSACGAMINFRILSVSSTATAIDSVVCPDHVIDNADKENLKIYFRIYPENEP